MANNFSLTGITADQSGNLKDDLNDSGRLFRLPVLDVVSYSIALICALFFLIFAIDKSMSVSWFFISEIIALCLIPVLSRQGFETIAKFLLILYVDIAIIILSSIFDGKAEIQYFLIPAMGLSILLLNTNRTGSEMFPYLYL